MKLWKLHTLTFRCPCCGKVADYAAQVVDGPHKGTVLDPTYWCEKCSSAVRARDTWLFGATFGPLMAMVATFAVEALPPGLELAQWATLCFAAICCAIVGWPLSRTLSRHLVYWEPRDPRHPGALRQAHLKRLRDEED